MNGSANQEYLKDYLESLKGTLESERVYFAMSIVENKSIKYSRESAYHFQALSALRNLESKYENKGLDKTIEEEKIYNKTIELIRLLTDKQHKIDEKVHNDEKPVKHKEDTDLEDFNGEKDE